MNLHIDCGSRPPYRYEDTVSSDSGTRKTRWCSITLILIIIIISLLSIAAVIIAIYALVSVANKSATTIATVSIAGTSTTASGTYRSFTFVSLISEHRDIFFLIKQQQPPVPSVHNHLSLPINIRLQHHLNVLIIRIIRIQHEVLPIYKRSIIATM